MKENADLLVLLLKLFDSIIIILGGVFCFYILEPIKNFPKYSGILPDNYLTLIVLGFIFSAWWFPSFKVYQSWRSSNIIPEIRALFFSWGCSLLGILTFIFFTKTATEFSRHWFLLWFASVFTVLIISRLCLRTVLRKLRYKGLNLRHIVVIGEGEHCLQVSQKIQKATWMGLNIKGFFSDISPLCNTDLTYLGKTQDIASYVDSHSIDQVWITLPLKAMDKIDIICQSLHSSVVEVILVPDISGLRLLNYSSTELDGMPIINMTVSPMSSLNRLSKWIEDFFLSLLILILISPLLLLIAIAVKLTSPGPIFYRQERVGNNGRTFQMLKFRSMPLNTDKELVWGNATAKQKTAIGDFLRKTSLDELPQFINVLKGDMSIVGPRPERTVFVNKFKHDINYYMKKHLVHAGITGWAQVNGWRGDTNLNTRINYDLFYIENWSVWFDLKIIWLTLFNNLSYKDNNIN